MWTPKTAGHENRDPPKKNKRGEKQGEAFLWVLLSKPHPNVCVYGWNAKGLDPLKGEPAI